MIIYNVTVNVDDTIAEEWLKWMKEKHLNDVLNTGMFEQASLSRLLTRQEDETGVTYVVQYMAKDMAHYERYRDEFAPSLQADGKNRFGDKFIAFRTLMESLNY
jgi:hypothetical protein